jgi:hypothetical protein
MILLNSDNPAIAAALQKPEKPSSVQLIEALEIDFVADLVGRALMDRSFWDTYASEDSPDTDLSVGALVRSLVRTKLCAPTESVDEGMRRLHDLIIRDPSMWRALVQEGLGYPGGAKS